MFRTINSLYRIALQSRHYHITSNEVKRTLERKLKPVVSLESTIITHGLPYPNNLHMARSVEKVIRENGGIPATCAFLEGVPHIGLSDSQLESLAKAKNVNKVSRRDIGYTMSNKINGGTTIALTMILSQMAGIKVFATGGLGGVHKDGQLTFDISADLTELGRTPVTVVCAGPKSILDIPLTLEYLETQGVFVSTYNDDGRENVQVPGFYCRESGEISPYSFSGFDEIARSIHSSEIMGLRSGNIICVPPPIESALSSGFINEIIENANVEAKKMGIKGKELTPFLLGKIAKDTNGKSVDCNIEFVLNNAKIATKIAVELLRLENSAPSAQHQQFVPSAAAVEAPRIVESKKSALVPESREQTENSAHREVHTLVIGSVAVDTISSISSPSKQNDSNPGSIRTSIGGVGYNINLAATYSAATSRLISVVGDDLAGKSILDQMSSQSLDTSGILVKSGSTAQYASTHSDDGELIIAVADMAIIETDFSAHIIDQIDSSSPNLIVFDSNLSPQIISKVLAHIQDIDVIVEPTSFAKASRLAHFNSVFPNNQVKLITPTILELGAIYEAFSKAGLLNDYDSWFPVLDSLGIDSMFRERLNASGNKHKVIGKLLEQGVLQLAFQLVPYFQNILIKLGDQGAIIISLSTSAKDYKSIPTTSKYKPEFILASEGQTIEDNSMGVVVQYFKIPLENRDLKIKNVTGAGDSLLGYLVASLERENWLSSDIESIEQEWGKWESIYKGQLASGTSLSSDSAISEEISRIN